jgi:hypothetical protein
MPARKSMNLAALRGQVTLRLPEAVLTESFGAGARSTSVFGAEDYIRRLRLRSVVGEKSAKPQAAYGGAPPKQVAILQNIRL